MAHKATKTLRNLTVNSKFSISEGVRRSKCVISELAANRQNLRAANFTALDKYDLEQLFHSIDKHFFYGEVHNAIKNDGHRLSFRVSPRMTNSGGITTTRFPKNNLKVLDFEIAIASTLLFESFRDQKPIIVTGLLCGDRRQALKRVMEHEMIHLIEMLIWKNSSCSARRFQSIARRFFSHKQSTHQLLTPADTAAAKFRISPGDWVCFQVNGHPMTGFVNRITKRATVLVPSKNGMRYDDGKRYNKYYVPIEKLSKAA